MEGGFDLDEVTGFDVAVTGFSAGRLDAEDDDVVAGTDADNWSTAEFRAFVWGDADGRGDDIFRLIGTRDLVNEFDPDVGPHP